MSDPFRMAAAPAAGARRSAPAAGASPQPVSTPVGLVHLALWLGLVSGFAQVVWYLSTLAGGHLTSFYAHPYARLGARLLWMPVLAQVAMLVPPAACIAVGARRWPRLAGRVWCVALLLVPAYLGVLLLIASLHPYAALLLACGLAARTAPGLASSPRLHAGIRRSTGWLVVLLLGLATGVHGWQALAERRALAALPPAPTPAAPNVLLIVLDTVRARTLGLYGGRQSTPWIDELARGGVRFDRAISTAPWTTPSHASMFTARFPHELSADWNAPLDEAQPTLAGVLSAHGYVTAGFVGNVTHCGYASGLARGFVHYAAAGVSAGELIESCSVCRLLASSARLRGWIGYYDMLGRKGARDVNRELLDWLDGRGDDRPFFVFLNYFDAHAPYLPPPPSGDAVPDDPPRRRNPFLLPDPSWSDAEIEAERQAYRRAIGGLDRQLAELFAALRERDLVDRTIVILTADHGEEFGEAGLFEHGHSVNLAAIHVPLIISFPPRVPAGMVVRAPVSLQQIPATVVDLAGLPDVRFPGASLVASLDGGTPPLAEVSHAPNLPDWFPVSRGGLRSLVIGDYQYIVDDGGTEQLLLIDQAARVRPAPADAAARRAVDRARSMLGGPPPVAPVASSVVSPSGSS